MLRPDAEAALAQPIGARALVALALIGWSAMLAGCLTPPTMPALRHTGRLAPPNATGLFRVGGTTDFDTVAGPDIGWRFRLEERVELDVSGYAIVAFSETSPNYAALGRLGVGVGLLEHEHGAIALLVGIGAGGLHEEHDEYRHEPTGVPPEHYVLSDPLVGGDIGLAGSLRYGWFEPYLGFRVSAVARLYEGDPETVVWLMPALGVRFLADQWAAVSIEWTNGLYFVPDVDGNSDCCSWMTGASLAIELGPNGS